MFIKKYVKRVFIHTFGTYKWYACMYQAVGKWCIIWECKNRIYGKRKFLCFSADIKSSAIKDYEILVTA